MLLSRRQTFAAGAILASPLLLWALLKLITICTPEPYGDLSRLGRLSERAFGWQAEATSAAPWPAAQGVPLDEADALVIGDSFSMTHVWQGALSASGLRHATIYWGQIGGLCTDFKEWAHAAGFRGQWIIVESIERSLPARLAGAMSCDHMAQRFPVLMTSPFVPSRTHAPAFRLNLKDPPSMGWTTFLNTLAATMGPPIELRGHVRVLPVPDGCLRFSHSACDRALFTAEDEQVSALSAKTIESMSALSNERTGPRILWLVVPNKTSVYVDTHRSSDFAQALAQSRLGPDLFTGARRAAQQIRDFYYPNDSHLSHEGQVWLGKQVVSALGRSLPTEGRQD